MADGIVLKSAQEIEAMKPAGRLSAKVLRKVGELVRPGVSTLELDQFAEGLIRLEGGIPAFLGYIGYPASICASVNDQVVHGIPSKDVILREGDIIAIDVGAIVDGWVGDNAATFAVGEISIVSRRLLEVTEASMWAGLAQATPGNHMGDIGHAVQKVVESAGFGVVHKYVGHGIGRKMHEGPNVPNLGRRRRGIELVPGMVLAIEPMVNMGSADTSGPFADGWTVYSEDGSPSAHFERTVAITEDGPVILTAE
jgi:methionyl aminopeptidase